MQAPPQVPQPQAPKKEEGPVDLYRPTLQNALTTTAGLGGIMAMGIASPGAAFSSMVGAMAALVWSGLAWALPCRAQHSAPWGVLGLVTKAQSASRQQLPDRHLAKCQLCLFILTLNAPGESFRSIMVLCSGMACLALPCLAAVMCSLLRTCSQLFCPSVRLIVQN